MRVGVVEDIRACEQRMPEWQALRAHGASLIFTSPWWAVASWRHFPDLGRPRLVAVSSPGGDLLGVMPLTGGPEHVSWAGSPLGDEHDVQLHQEAAGPNVAQVLVAAAVQLVNGYQTLTLRDVRPDGIVAGLGNARQGCPAPTLCLKKADAEFGAFACIPGWSRVKRRGLRSRWAMLHRAGHVRVEHIDNPVGLREVLPRFVEGRLAAWTERGRLDELPVMDRHPNFPRFLAEAASGLASVGRCYLGRLYFNENPIAQALYFRAQTADLLYMSTYDEQFYRYSPSHLLLAAVADAALRKGKHVIELGRGDESYKFDHGAKPRYLQDVDL
jgi:CelD/BcsL family acetyltransferase involved in cellulose biosynthesis